MHCPYCASANTEVVETRVAEDGSNIRRRRMCEKCAKRFTTYERIDNVMLGVIKKDGKREQFSREKLKTGLLRACGKTSVTMAQIESIVDAVEREVLSGDSVEVESKKIGQAVAARLKKIDKVAYIRFSSVFRRFVDVEDFEKELRKLIK